MGALSSLATVGLNLALAQQAAERRSRQITAERDRDIQAIRERDEEARREDEERLRRQLAAQRARAAAAGVAGRGGSADAVLRGLIEESEAEARAREQTSARRIAEIRRRAGASRRQSLLDLVGEAGQSSFRQLGRRTGQGLSLLDR